MDATNEPLLMAAQVAERLQVSAATLCRWRRSGVGPRVVWLTPSMPRYREGDINEWLSGRSR